MQYIHPIVLCGFMGCGKSVIGRLTAEKLGFAFADTDDMLLARTGMTLQQMFALGGEPYFREREYETVCAAAQLQRTVISTGGGDNFNAGFCTGLLLGCDVRQCLLLGMGASGYYVGNGHSADLQELTSHMKNWNNQ